MQKRNQTPALVIGTLLTLVSAGWIGHMLLTNIDELVIGPLLCMFCAGIGLLVFRPEPRKMIALRKAGLIQAQSGMTSIEEVLRVVA